MKWGQTNIGKSQQGFTLVELIVVVLILGILATFTAPALVGYIDKSREHVCVHNRATIERVYIYQKNLNEFITLQDVVDDAQGAHKLVENAACPSGGTYSLNDAGAIICSIHGGAGSSESEGDTGGSTGGGGDNTGGDGGNTGGDDGDTGGDGHDKTPTEIVEEKLHEIATDWEDFKKKVEESANGMNFSTGTLISEGGSIFFVARHDNYIGNSEADSIHDYDPNGNTFAQIDTSVILTSADYDQNGRWSNPPHVGSLYEYEGSIYVCVYGPGQWAQTNPTKQGNWVKIL